MKLKEIKIGTIFSIIALIASLSSICVTMYIYYETKRTNMYQMNIGLQYESEKLIKNDEDLLLLHGINPKEVKNDSISQEEFYYILASLRASEAYYIINNKPARLSKLRTHFLNNKKVELVYKKYLRNKLISSPVFVDLVDQFYLDKDSPNYYDIKKDKK